MKINKIEYAPLYAHRNTEKTAFGAYKLAPQWQPFITEIQNNAAMKCVGNMDGDFFRKLAQDLDNLKNAKINLAEIIEAAKSRIVHGTEYNENAMAEFNKLTKKISSKIENPSDVDVLVSKPYWGMTRPETTGEAYPASLTDSFIDLIIPETDYKYSHKIGTQRRFFFFGTHDDDFYFARKLWNNSENAANSTTENKTPYRQMLDDFTEALTKGFEDIYNGIAKNQEVPNETMHGSSSRIAPFINDKQFNNEFLTYTFIN